MLAHAVRGEARRSGILVASPPVDGVGGIATHTGILLHELPEARVFDQWWPLKDRSASSATRLAMHALALVRLTANFLARPPEVVHLQVSERGLPRDILYARMAKVFGLPVVAHLHSEFTSADRIRALRPLWHLSDLVITLDSGSRDRLLSEAGGTRVEFLNNPVAPLFADTPVPTHRGTGSSLRLFCPALVGELKNQLGILHALERAADRGVEATLHMAGMWDAEFSEEERHELLTHPRGRFLGALGPHEMLHEYDEADAMVLFSRTEGEPMAVLEAMARALPVLASDVGAIRTMLVEDTRNILVPRGDQEALAAAVVHLAALPAEERRVPANREKVATTRSPAAHADALASLYGPLMDRERPDPSVLDAHRLAD